MGATSHSGLPPRSLSLPYTVKGTLRNTPPTRGESSCLTRDIKTAEKRSHNPGSLKSAGFYLSTFSGPQKRWGTKASNQPQGLEQVNTLGAFPDGGSAHACRCTGSQRLVGRTRSQRCLPPDTHPPRTSQTPTVSVGGCHLKFSMSPVWTVISSKGFHKGPETNSGLSRADRDSAVDISGRYANHVSGERHTSGPSGSHCSIVSISGFDCQQQQIHSGPFTLSKIPGLLHQHCVNADPPSQGKMRKLKQEAQSLLAHKSVTVRDLTSFIGKASASSRAIQIAPLHYRALQRMVNAVIPFLQSQEEIQRKYSTVLSLTASAQEDLEWWINQAAKSCIAPIPPRIPALVIESDASNMGWGAVCQNKRTGGLWSRKEALHHINYLELLAAFLALKSFMKGMGNLVVLKIDNITALTYINKMGGTHSHLLCSLALEMWSWCLRRNIWMVAEHLPGVKNLAADSESRTIKDRYNWMLNPQVFRKLNRVMGPLKIDLFASRLTHQVPLYFSWRPDAEAIAVDAFTQDWAQRRGYANPLWCLTPRCLSQIKCQGARVLLITPLWRTQPWFPVLLEMLEDYPRILPGRSDLTLSPTGQKFIMNQAPTLVTWPICGIPSSQEAFRTQLQNSCSPPGEQRQPPITTPCSTSGLVGVSRGIEIPLMAL